MLPTFLGIGAPKAGTTWVHRLLESHPDVAVPAHRKEVHYFDLHFDDGPTWYERFFPTPAPGAPAPKAVGEFTPHYLYDPAVPARVASVPTIDRFLVTLRNPVDRAFSHYRFRRRQDNSTLSFEGFLDREPTAVQWGLYGRHLAPWFAQLPPERFLVLVYEDAVADPAHTEVRIADHLGIDPHGFPADAGTAPANEAFVPRRRRAYAGAVRQARWLRHHDLDPVITLARRTGVLGVLKRPAPAENESVSPELRARLWAGFEADVVDLEALTGIDLARWRPAASAS